MARVVKMTQAEWDKEEEQRLKRTVMIIDDHEVAVVRKLKHLRALHNEFRVAAARLNFVANWLENTHASGTESARAARRYANAAKEVLDKGLDWLVEQRGY